MPWSLCIFMSVIKLEEEVNHTEKAKHSITNCKTQMNVLIEFVRMQEIILLETMSNAIVGITNSIIIIEENYIINGGEEIAGIRRAISNHSHHSLL